MAEKGDRGRLEPVARQLYVDGKSLVAISEMLEVSRQTLTDWKSFGNWDAAKAAKDNYEAQLLQARDQIVEKIVEAPLTAGSYIDTLSKIDAILDRRAKAVRETAEAVALQKSQMFLDFVRDLLEFGHKIDPAIVQVVQDNFDDLIQWGREKYAA